MKVLFQIVKTGFFSLHLKFSLFSILLALISLSHFFFFSLQETQGRDERRPPAFYFSPSSSDSKEREDLPEKKDKSLDQNKAASSSHAEKSSVFSENLSHSRSPSLHEEVLLLLNENKGEKTEEWEKKRDFRKSSFQEKSPVLILNTEGGFIPKKVRLFKNTPYKLYIVNTNEEHQNASFILSAFSKYHGTYYGKVVSFELLPKREGMFPFQSPETEAEGWLIVLPEKSQFLDFIEPKPNKSFPFPPSLKAKPLSSLYFQHKVNEASPAKDSSLSKKQRTPWSVMEQPSLEKEKKSSPSSPERPSLHSP